MPSRKAVDMGVHAVIAAIRIPPVFLFGALSKQIVAAPEKRNWRPAILVPFCPRWSRHTPRSVARFGRNRLCPFVDIEMYGDLVVIQCCSHRSRSSMTVLTNVAI